MKRIDEIANNAEMSEKAIERYLVKKTASLGGKALKYDNPHEVGYPDRIVLLPNGITAWCELKSKGKKPRPVQTLRIMELKELGQLVFVCDSRAKVDEMLDYLMTI